MFEEVLSSAFSIAVAETDEGKSLIQIKNNNWSIPVFVVGIDK